MTTIKKQKKANLLKHQQQKSINQKRKRTGFSFFQQTKISFSKNGRLSKGKLKCKCKNGKKYAEKIHSIIRKKCVLTVSKRQRSMLMTTTKNNCKNNKND